MQFLFRSTTKKAKNLSVLRLILNQKPGMFGIKIFSENQAFLACSSFGQQFKVKPDILLYSSTGIKPQHDQERHAGTESSENLISCLLSLPVYIFDLKEL